VHRVNTTHRKQFFNLRHRAVVCRAYWRYVAVIDVNLRHSTSKLILCDMHTQRHFNFPPSSFVASALLGRALHRICPSTASRSPVLTRGGICVPPTVTYLPYRVSGLTLTAVGRSQLLTRWPGTLFRILSGIQRAAQPVLGVYLKRTCSRDTSASSALGVLSDYALYKSTHSLSQSLTRIA